MLRMLYLALCCVLALSGCSSNGKLNQSTPKGFKGTYWSKGNESWEQIAQRHQTSSLALQRFNPRIQADKPPKGSKLLIPERESDVSVTGPYFYRIQAGDTFSSLAQHFHLALVSVLQANPKAQPEKLRIGQRVVIPTQNRNQHSFVWPVQQPKVGINFSWQRWGLHQGLALETNRREEVFPIAAGTVIFAGPVRGLGRVVIVKHEQGLQSIYAYCHAVFVEQDAWLNGKHPVCAAGKQRRLDKKGIYLELRQDGLPVPPEDYLPALPW